MDTWKERTIIRLLSAKFRIINLFSTRKAGAGSINVLIYPMMSKKIPKLKSDVDHPQKATITSSDDIKTELYDWGKNGATTLLIHGWDSNTYRWYDMIDHMAEDDLRFVALDGPYHGASEGDHFNMIHFANMIGLAIEKFQPVNIIAHSLGALAMAYHLQERHYNKLKKLILLSPVADLSWHIDRYHKLLSLPQRTRKAMDDHFEYLFDRKFVEFNFKGFEMALKCDILIMHSEEDKVVPITDSEAVHSWFSESKFIRFKGLGHNMQSEVIYDHISAFLKKE